MKTIKAREQNLFNAMDTMAQFYEEIESFLNILFDNMVKLGFTGKAERLRSGTATSKNLSRRILASATMIFFKDIADEEDEEEVDDDEGEFDTKKSGKLELVITNSLCVPFVQVSLFPPREIPSVNTLSSPTLLMGVLGKMSFIDKGTGKRANPSSPVMAISNLQNIQISSKKKVGDTVHLNCWKPASMKKYKLEAKLVGFESKRLLEIDSQEKIKEIADKLAKLCKRK